MHNYQICNHVTDVASLEDPWGSFKDVISAVAAYMTETSQDLILPLVYAEIVLASAAAEPGHTAKKLPMCRGIDAFLEDHLM